MGEFLDKVLQRKTAPEALAHRVALSISSGGRALIVEAGDDVFFYGAMLRRERSTVRVDLFSADGRRSVVRALQLLGDIGKGSATFGIVDRDLNLDDGDLLVDGRCLVLDVYSYEMYLADESILKDVGKHIFALEVGSEHLAWWESMVSGLLETLPGLMVDEMAIAYWAKANKKVCHLNNFGIFSCISVGQDGKLVRSESFRDVFIADTSCPFVECSAEAFAEAKARIEAERWERVTRGHVFWEIVTAVADLFRTRLDGALKQAGANRSRTRHQLSGRHLLEAAISAIHSPGYITDFLNEKVLA